MDKEELEILKNNLPNGHLETLNRLTGYTKGYIAQVLAGERTNNEIIDAAIALAKKEKKRNDRRKAEIANLT